MSAKLTPYKMGDFLKVKHGFPFLGEFFSTSGNYIVLTPGNFYERGGFKRTFGKEKYYISDFPEEYLCSEGDLVVAMTEQAEGLLGSTAIIPEHGVYLHNQRIGLISWDVDIVDKQYLYYLFMTRSVRKQIRDTATGTKVKHTSPERIYDVDVFLPDINVQQKNAALLWMLDQKIQLNNRIIAELEEMAKTIYDYWFVQFDFPNAEGKPYRSSGGEMVWNEQLKSEIPKGWTVGTINDLGSIISGGTPDTSNEKYYCSEGIAWITPNDLTGRENMMFIRHGERDITTEGLKNSSATILPYGSVLLSTRAPIGYLAIAENELCTNQGFKSLVPNKGYSQYFIYYLIKRNIDAISQQGVGTTFKEVSKETLSKFKVVLPPHRITCNYSDIVATFCNMRRRIENEIIELANLRDWLLPMLMNGQVMVG